MHNKKIIQLSLNIDNKLIFREKFKIHEILKMFVFLFIIFLLIKQNKVICEFIVKNN